MQNQKGYWQPFYLSALWFQEVLFGTGKYYSLQYAGVLNTNDFAQ